MLARLITIVATATALLAIAPQSSSSSCPRDVLASFGFCPTISNDGSAARVGGSKPIPGRNPISSPIGNDSPRDQGPPPPPPFKLCERSVTHLRVCPKESEPADPTAPPAPGIPGITLTDLAQFAPNPVAATGEPDNLGVAGMPTNFVAAASAHTRAGALFGIPVTVRFTPVGFDFRYGDGDTTTTTTGGQTWSALGQATFTPTATSHIYRERGTYDASVTVRYTAEVDLGTGWFPVEGQLSIDGPTQQIRIFEAHTALVARTCVEQPAAPGC